VQKGPAAGDHMTS